MSTRDAKMKNLRLKLETLFESYDKKSKSTSPSTEPREIDQQNVCGGPKGTFENYDVSVSCILFCSEISNESFLIIIIFLQKKPLQDFFAFRKVSVIAGGKTTLLAYLDEPALDMSNFQSLGII